MQLRYPAEIDAHLSFAALENTPVTITVDGESFGGHIGFPDTFGTVNLFTQGATAITPETEIWASYRVGNQVLQFVTRVVQSIGNRWQLRRPRNISVTYTDSADFQS
jgi:hypothetical protein